MDAAQPAAASRTIGSTPRTQIPSRTKARLQCREIPQRESAPKGHRKRKAARPDSPHPASPSTPKRSRRATTQPQSAAPKRARLALQHLRFWHPVPSALILRERVAFRLSKSRPRHPQMFGRQAYHRLRLTSTAPQPVSPAGVAGYARIVLVPIAGFPRCVSASVYSDYPISTRRSLPHHHCVNAAHAAVPSPGRAGVSSFLQCLSLLVPSARRSYGLLHRDSRSRSPARGISRVGEFAPPFPQDIHIYLPDRLLCRSCASGFRKIAAGPHRYFGWALAALE